MTSKFKRRNNLMRDSQNPLYKHQNTFKNHKRHLKLIMTGSLTNKGKSNNLLIEWKE